MLMLIYTIAAMFLTPIAYEFLNRKVSESGRISYLVRSWPAYIINVIVCGLFAVGSVLLSADRSLWNWIILTALIYFGNQFVYQTIIKLWMRTKQV